jgi:hypothetical protein
MTNENTQFGGFITAIGAAKQTNANALGIPWKITHMLIGDAGGDPNQTPDPVPSMLQEELINQVYRAPLNQLRVSPDDENVLIAELILPPNVGGWWIRELALEDEEGDFVATAKPAPSYKPLLVQGSGRTQTVRMHIIANGTANIQLKIDPAVVLATRAYADQVVDDLEKRLADETSESLGAGMLGWRGATAGEFLDGGWFTPKDLDLTGVTDESNKVLTYLTQYKRVRLPKTAEGQSIKLQLTMPNGTSLVGHGAMEWSGISWTGEGTLVVGAVRLNDRKSCVVACVSIDGYALGINPLAGAGPLTENHYIRRVNTRANSHGQLWEQKGNDPIGDYGGNIRVEDCKHWGGPNGFVTKMRAVHFVRCKSYGTSVQSFVIASDNITGANVYSRASGTLMVDCYADGGNEGIRIYSRDHFSLANENGVLGVKDTKIFGFSHGVFSQFVMRTGDSGSGATNGNFARVLNADLHINGRFLGFGGNGTPLHLEMVDRVDIDSLFGNNAGGVNISFGNQVFGVDRGKLKTNGVAMIGAEKLAAINPINSTVIDLTLRPKIIRFQNNAFTSISTINGLTGVPFFEFTCIIEDGFTRLSFITAGTLHGKRGDSIDIVWDGASFFVKAIRSIFNDVETVIVPAAEISFDFWASRTHRMCAFPIATVSSFDVSNPATLIPGDTYTLRIGAGNGVAQNITAWSANFVFTATNPAPTTVPASGGRLLSFKAIGGKLVCESILTY